MLPAQRNKVDISKLTEEEQKLFRLYGKLPTHKNVITKMQKDRKYFDSGDYAMSKAGKAPQNSVGTAIPNPENIPHATPSPSINTAQAVGVNSSSSPTSLVSPVKEYPSAHPAISPSHLAQEEKAPETAEAAAEDAPDTTEKADADPADLAAPAKDTEMEV